MTGKFDKKILFNISQVDADRMTEMRLARGLDQSEYIRRAIRMYVAEQKLEELSSSY
ncbi:MAG: ribbon-helix-helix protein, CopG family [Sneathiella sp.]